MSVCEELGRTRSWPLLELAKTLRRAHENRCRVLGTRIDATTACKNTAQILHCAPDSVTVTLSACLDERFEALAVSQCIQMRRAAEIRKQGGRVSTSSRRGSASDGSMYTERRATAGVVGLERARAERGPQRRAAHARQGARRGTGRAGGAGAWAPNEKGTEQGPEAVHVQVCGSGESTDVMARWT